MAFYAGHSPGHVSYFRPEDGTLLVGDAFATVNLDSLPALLTRRPEISRPPTPFTCDWTAAGQSVKLLASFIPFTVGCGHGRPMSGPNIALDLNSFADSFTPPAHGRYVGSPARTNENGIVSVPPPAPDTFPLQAAAAAVALGAAVALMKQRS